jgi:hypothetical protein
LQMNGSIEPHIRWWVVDVYCFGKIVNRYFVLATSCLFTCTFGSQAKSFFNASFMSYVTYVFYSSVEVKNVMKKA